MAGGTPIEVPAIGVCDGIAMGHLGMKYSLASRELIADSTETMALAHCFDGLVLVPNCDKIVPGMVMAAVRLNLPSIVVSGGPMLAGNVAGERTSLSKMFEAVGARKAGLIDDEQLEEFERGTCPGCGSCSGMYTANSLNCLCEAIGIAPVSYTTLDVYKRQGVAFGVWQGLGLCLIGAALGSTIIFLFTKKLGIKLVEVFVPLEKIRQLKFLQNNRRLHVLVFLLFWIPGVPKDVLTYFVGLTEMKLPAFLAISTVARIPSALMSTSGGAALGSGRYKMAVWIFVGSVALGLVGAVYYRQLVKKEQRKKRWEDEAKAKQQALKAQQRACARRTKGV